MRKIERNGESKLKRKLPTSVSRNNGIKTDVVVCCSSDKRKVLKKYTC